MATAAALANVAIGCLLLLVASGMGVDGCSSVSIMNLSTRNLIVCAAQSFSLFTTNDLHDSRDRFEMNLLPGSSQVLPFINCSWPIKIWASVANSLGCLNPVISAAEFNLSSATTGYDFYRVNTFFGYSNGLSISPEAANCGAPLCYIDDIYHFCTEPNELIVYASSRPTKEIACAQVFTPGHYFDSQIPSSSALRFKDACPTSYTCNGDSGAIFSCPANTQYNVTFLTAYTATNDTDALFSERIGEGGFGTVYRGQLEDGTPVAIKHSKWQSSPEHKQQFLNKVKILTKVHHRNLVMLLGCSLANRTALLVLEHVPNGTLQDHLRNKPETSMTWRQRLRIALQTADALAYLHSATNPPIYHLDVKSANILLDQDLDAKVADFGISKLAPALDSSHITALEGIPGTIGYVDPKACVSSYLSAKSDVYSFGVVLLELISAQPAVVGTNKSLVSWAIELIASGEVEKIMDPGLCLTFQSAIGKESITSVAKLAAECLRSRSRKRPSMREVWIALQVV